MHFPPYPFLYAALRILHLAEESHGEYASGDLALVLAVALSLVAVICGVVVLAFRAFGNRANGRVVSLIAFLAVVALFSREPLRAMGIRRPLEPWHILLACAVAAGSALLVGALARRPRLLQNTSAFLTLTTALLVLRFSGGIAVDQFRAPDAIRSSQLIRALTRPIEGPARATPPARDVYLIVLDEYASSAVLRERFGFDNRPFEDSLRARGFHLPVVGSNYTETSQVLPALLSAAHIRPLAEESEARGTGMAVLGHLVEHSRVAMFLRQRGYRFVLFPSSWWKVTQSSGIADSVVQVWAGFDLDWAASRTELRRAVLRETLLMGLFDHSVYGEHIQHTFDEFGRLPSVEGPVFGFAHILSPHIPYVFDRQCGPLSQSRANRDPDGSYVAQVECLNRMILRLVDRLLRDSEVPPVILLQGDHGTSRLGYNASPCAARVTAAAARERLGTLGAYHLPDGGARAFGDSVTVVNVLGNVLRHYFHAELPAAPDDQYVVVWDAPYDFLRVNPAWVAGEVPGSPQVCP